MFLNIFRSALLWGSPRRAAMVPLERRPAMTTLPFTLQVDPTPMQFLFTVRGPLVAKDLEGGRVAHNMAAGSDQGVAAARSFSDLSHAVYVPVKPNGAGAGELLIIDYWSNPAGIGTFFSDPQVQQGGTMVYKD